MMEARRVLTEFYAKQLHHEPRGTVLFRAGDEVVLLRSQGGHDFFARLPAPNEGRPEEYVTTDFALKTEPIPPS